MKVILASSGSGGHLFPSLSLAKALKEREPEIDILFVGSQKPLERRIVEGHGLAFLSLPATGLPFGISLNYPVAVLNFFLSLKRALALLREFQPQVVVGFGGYVSAPLLIAAYMRKVPSLIHEQNVLPGRANRLISRFVSRIALSFPKSRVFFPKKVKTTVTGNPIRQEILQKDALDPFRKFGLARDRLTLLVSGGSQGAHRLNHLILEALALMGEDERRKIQVLHLSGERDYEMVRSRYSVLGVKHRAFAFLEDIGPLYRATDLVLSRAGAGTLAELSACGLPAILVPYPHSKRHQMANARVIEDAGGALVFSERDITGKVLKDVLLKLMRNSDELKKMSSAMRKLACTDATRKLADEVLELTKNCVSLRGVRHSTLADDAAI